MPPYPDIEPHAEGLLDTGDGNHIHWQSAGNPDGVPALILHGGPGSGSSPAARRFFDPEHYRIVQFDQRGCGKSLPNAVGEQSDFATNTTWHLVDDIERLRLHFGADSWIIFGNSWGCTLALAYAETKPAHVRALVLAGITTTRKSEIDWLYRGMAPLFPQEWDKFRRGVSGLGQDADLVAAYHERLHSDDMAVARQAAMDWHAWEAASILVASDGRLPRRWSDIDYLLTRARIITHYFLHAGWLNESQLLLNADRLADIPGVLIQGRLDLEAPLVTAWELSRAWPSAQLVILPDAAHSTTTNEMAAAIVAATDAFRLI